MRLRPVPGFTIQLASKRLADTCRFLQTILFYLHDDSETQAIEVFF